jgi:hypothetical protein
LTLGKLPRYSCCIQSSLRAQNGLNNQRQIHGGEHPFVNSREKIDAIPTLERA